MLYPQVTEILAPWRASVVPAARATPATREAAALTDALLAHGNGNRAVLAMLPERLAGGAVAEVRDRWRST
jgi:hypothetical protein